MEDSIENFVEFISTTLQPYKSIVAHSATIFQIAQMLSPLAVFNNMRKAKSTLGVPFFPFLLGLVLTCLSIRHSELINDDATFNANVVGLTIMLVYATIFSLYVTKEEQFSHYLKIFLSLSFTIIALVYSKYENPELIKTRFEFIISCLFYSFFVSPIIETFKAIKMKCTKQLPLPMIASGTLVGFAWLLHGFIVKSYFIIAQNLLIQVINIVQLSLFMIYPSEPEETSPKTNDEKIKLKSS